MAVTANGTPYVESSDLVANYPAVSLALAEHIDDVSAILQIVRATDTTQRSTTSATFVDVTGMSVTITPQRSDSSIIIIATYVAIIFTASSSILSSVFQITDSSNNAISGAQKGDFAIKNATELDAYQTLVGYDTPGTIAATTYKLRFLAGGSDTTIANNGDNTGQMYAIEVSA